MLVLEKLGLIRRPIRPNAPLGWFSVHDGNIIGGMMVGLGMALSGACPGTVLVQLAQGIPTARAAAIGAVLGGVTFARFQRFLKRQHPELCQPCKSSIMEKTSIPEVALYTSLPLIVAGVVSFTPASGRNTVLSPELGGLLIGTVQAASLLLLASPLGVSAVYEHIGQYMCLAFGNEKCGKPKGASKTVLTALGIISGSIALTKYLDLPGIAAADPQIAFWQALLGGWVMVFGARLAGGCTSGHGLSGLSAMSFSSLLSVGGMFGAGIAAQQLMQLY